MSWEADRMQDEALRWATESVVCPKHPCVRLLPEDACHLCEDGEEFHGLAPSTPKPYRGDRPMSDAKKAFREGFRVGWAAATDGGHARSKWIDIAWGESYAASLDAPEGERKTLEDARAAAGRTDPPRARPER